MINSLIQAKDNLMRELSPVEQSRYAKHGVIRVTGSDGEVYYISNAEARLKFGVATITALDGNGICFDLDIPWMISYEKMLIFKKLIEADVYFLQNYEA